MTTWTDPHSAARNGGPPPTPAEPTLAGLCEAVTDLAAHLPGPVRRLSVRAGRLAVEVEMTADGVQLITGTTGGMTGGTTGATTGGTPSGTTAQDPAHAVRSPLVGTFYAAPSPGSEPFVQVGDRVEAGQQVGIVEAMKLMNAIVTEQGGTVVETPVPDGASVEYDQPLVLLRPDPEPS